MLGFAKPPQAAVNQDVMQYKIEHAVQTYSYSHPKAVIQLLHSEKDQHHCNTSKQQGKQVIPFKKRMGRLVMGLVNHPKWAMHQILMNKPAREFHGSKSKSDIDDRQQHLSRNLFAG